MTVQLISASILATKIVQSIYFLNQNFKPLALVWLYSLDCVGHGSLGNPKERVSRDPAHITENSWRLEILDYITMTCLYIDVIYCNILQLNG